MADNNHHREREDRDVQLPDLEQPGKYHEKTDINVWAVARFAIGLGCLAVVAFALLFGFFRFLESRNGGPLPHTGLNINAGALPPQPRLQVAPVTDLKEMLDAQDKLLHGYGWIDPERGVVRIPIERAIDLLAQRGLPARPAPGPASAAAGVTVPDESGLGPVMIAPGGPLHSQLENAGRGAAGGTP